MADGCNVGSDLIKLLCAAIRPCVRSTPQLPRPPPHSLPTLMHTTSGQPEQIWASGESRLPIRIRPSGLARITGGDASSPHPGVGVHTSDVLRTWGRSPVWFRLFCVSFSSPLGDGFSCVSLVKRNFRLSWCETDRLQIPPCSPVSPRCSFFSLLPTGVDYQILFFLPAGFSRRRSCFKLSIPLALRHHLIYLSP